MSHRQVLCVLKLYLFLQRPYKEGGIAHRPPNANIPQISVTL
jgi:hypothetical protein